MCSTHSVWLHCLSFVPFYSSICLKSLLQIGFSDHAQKTFSLFGPRLQILDSVPVSEIHCSSEFTGILKSFQCDSGVFYSVTSMVVLVAHQRGAGLNRSRPVPIHSPLEIGRTNNLRPFAGVCAVFRSYFDRIWGKVRIAQNTGICKTTRNQIPVNLTEIVTGFGILTGIW